MYLYGKAKWDGNQEVENQLKIQRKFIFDTWQW